MQLLTEALTIIIPLTAIIVTLFAWSRQDIKAQGERLDKRINELGKELSEAIRAQGERLDKRINEQGKELSEAIRAQGERLDKRINEQGKASSEASKTQGNELRQEIKSQSERIDELGRDIKILSADVASLKATVETFFRLRVDPPQPPDNPGPAQANKAA